MLTRPARHAEIIILAVAPTPSMARQALAGRGLDPVLPGIGLRMVTRCAQLRGWSHGTPVVAERISEWGDLAGHDGEFLAHTLLAQIKAGRLRLLQDNEVNAIMAGEG